MESPLDPTVYKEALIVLGAAGIIIPLFYRLRVSPVLGFMLVGVVVGPFGLVSLAPHLHKNKWSRLAMSVLSPAPSPTSARITKTAPAWRLTN